MLSCSSESFRCKKMLLAIVMERDICPSTSVSPSLQDVAQMSSFFFEVFSSCPKHYNLWGECLQHPNIQLPIPLTCSKHILRIWPRALNGGTSEAQFPVWRSLLFSEDHSSLWKVLWWRQRAPKNYRYKLVSSWRRDL